MKKSWLFTFFVIALLVFDVHSGFTAEYIIAEGDVLSIDVLGLKEMQIKEIIVRPDGKIDIPLIGEVQAAGHSSSDLSGILTERLKPFVKNPVTSVNIARFYAIKVYVLGEVQKPGIVQLQNPRNVTGAISGAGGWTNAADTKKVYLIRNQKKDVPIMVNLQAIVKNGDTTQDYALGNGDILFVDGSGRLNWGRDIVPLITSAYYLNSISDGNHNSSSVKSDDKCDNSTGAGASQ